MDIENIANQIADKVIHRVEQAGMGGYYDFVALEMREIGADPSAIIDKQWASGIVADHIMAGDRGADVRAAAAAYKSGMSAYMAGRADHHARESEKNDRTIREMDAE